MLKFTTLETSLGFGQCPEVALTAAPGFSHGSEISVSPSYAASFSDPLL